MSTFNPDIPKFIADLLKASDEALETAKAFKPPSCDAEDPCLKEQVILYTSNIKMWMEHADALRGDAVKLLCANTDTAWRTAIAGLTDKYNRLLDAQVRAQELNNQEMQQHQADMQALRERRERGEMPVLSYEGPPITVVRTE